MPHTEDEEALAFLEAVEWMKFLTCDGKITCVNVAFSPSCLAGTICSLAISLLGTRRKNWGWGVQDL